MAMSAVIAAPGAQCPRPESGPRPVRCLFLVPSLARGGAERQVVALLSGLDSAAFESHLLTFESGLDLLPQLDAGRVRFHHYPRRGRFDYAAVGDIARLIDGAGIDVIHCTLQMALLKGWLARRRARRRPPLVVALHTTVEPGLKTWLANQLLMQRLMRRCDRVICVSRYQAAHWRARFPFLHGLTEVIHNGVDPVRFDPAPFRAARGAIRRRLGIPGEGFVVACVAAFRPEKGHRLLIDAFRGLAERARDARLILVGDGPERAAAERRVADAGLSRRVVFTGGMADVRPVLAAADVAVLASRTETFPLAMLEALAMEVPVAAFAVGGIPEAVRPWETGLLVPPGDAARLAEALRYLRDHEEERQWLGRAGRELVLRDFAESRMVERTAAVLREVAGRE
jgi:glycosyltransferase involved in cell wall biosynthesis